MCVYLGQLESDPELKKKLASIARDKEIDELKKLIDQTNIGAGDGDIYGRPVAFNDPKSQKVYQKFVPYNPTNFPYNNMENEVYYYQNEDAKRSDP